MSTTTPRAGWRWRLMASILAGMAAGYLAARALGLEDGSAQAGIVAALTCAAGSSGRLRTALPVAGVLGLIVVAFSTLGALTTGHPLSSALAMAFVAFATSVLTAARPVGLLIGLMASYAYFLVTAVGVLAEQEIGSGLPQIGLLGAVGLGVGLALVAVRAAVEQAIGTAHTRTHRPSLIGPVRTSLRTFDDHAKNGVRRAIALGSAMFAFQVIASHNAFWVMLTIFVILAPNGRSTVRVAMLRVAGTLVGVLAVVALALLLPETAALPLAVMALALSLAASARSTSVSAALGAAAGAVIAGLPTGNFIAYAGARLLDTVIGAILALAAGYLLWPRSGGSMAVPADLAEEAASTGIRTEGEARAH